MAGEVEVTFVNQKEKRLFPVGMAVSDILRAANISFPLVCNGQGTCGKCRVKVSGDTTPPTSAELRQLGTSEFANGIRLACQIKLTGPLKLELLGEISSKNILQTGNIELKEIDPEWGIITITKPPILSWYWISKKLPVPLQPSLGILQEIALLAPETEELTIEYFGNEAIGLVSNNAATKYAVAVDIGTTTLAAYLVDLQNGAIVNTASAYNPQSSYGADVISRINYAGTEAGLDTLHRVIVSEINNLIIELLSGQGIITENIIQVTLVGNSCMIHLLAKVSPESLGKVPFEPVFQEMLQLEPAEIGLKTNPRGKVFILPGIGGFVGSDISAGVLACGLEPERKELFIDIGTNGEVIITGQGRMLACSTAAGPAFEGATIYCGMLANSGAITDVQFTGKSLSLTTINNEPPKGICGTGLIRALVELLQKGYINKTGRWEEEIDHPNYDPDSKWFYLVKVESNPVYISQQDIRQFQLAKGAVRTGLELLMKRLEISADELDTVYLAGAFGTYLRPEDAVYLGLLPKVPVEKIKAVGNTAGMGAVISILSKTALVELQSRVKKIEHVELAEDPEFTEVFTESMMF